MDLDLKEEEEKKRKEEERRANIARKNCKYYIPNFRFNLIIFR